MEKALKGAREQAAASQAQKEEVLKTSKILIQTHMQEKAGLPRVEWYNMVEKQVDVSCTTYSYRDGNHGIKETELKEYYDGTWMDHVAKLQEANKAPLFISKIGQCYSLGTMIGVCHWNTFTPKKREYFGRELTPEEYMMLNGTIWCMDAKNCYKYNYGNT